jgi:hypothetical protein
MRQADLDKWFTTHPIPKDLIFLPAKVDTGVSFPLG